MPRGGVDHVARPFAVGIPHRNRYATTPRDIEALSDSIERLGAIILKHEEITDVEINPLMVYEKGVMTIDARILLARR